eukprot:6159382-Lingulodinium_polyedra.AAC.1
MAWPEAPGPGVRRAGRRGESERCAGRPPIGWDCGMWRAAAETPPESLGVEREEGGGTRA